MRTKDQTIRNPKSPIPNQNHATAKLRLNKFREGQIYAQELNKLFRQSQTIYLRHKVAACANCRNIFGKSQV